MDNIQYFKQSDQVLWRCLFIWACEGWHFPKVYISMFEKWLESPQWLLVVSKPKVRMRVTSAWGQEYFAFYWDILMLRQANWSRGICKNCWFFGRWKTSGGHFDSQLGHVNSSAPIRRGVDCFTVSKLQRGSSSFNHSPRLLIATLNKCSGVGTSQRDCKAWPCNCLDHFHHKMADLASHRRLKNIFGCKLLMKRGFYLKSGTDLHNLLIGCKKSVRWDHKFELFGPNWFRFGPSVTSDYKTTSLSTRWFAGLAHVHAWTLYWLWRCGETGLPVLSNVNWNETCACFSSSWSVGGRYHMGESAVRRKMIK